MKEKNEHFRIQNWYPRLSVYSLPTNFVFLMDIEIQALQEGDTESGIAKGVIDRLASAMSKFPFTRFVGTDLVAPTDTIRFEEKRGAVCSATSAWYFLTQSAKVRNAARDGAVSAICVRPFRRMDNSREFRLFVKGGKLRAMSQYWMTRHYPRLEKVREKYWTLAVDFIDRNFWVLPEPDLVIDIYFTSKDEIIVIDLNPFGPPTDPLMLNTWDQDWQNTIGLKLIPHPTAISGDINVSF